MGDLPVIPHRERQGVPARFQGASTLVRVDVAAATHTGLVRSNNEDQFFVARLTRRLETVLSSLRPGGLPDRADETGWVMVVADGMGGHAAGEVASQTAVRALVELGLQIPDWFFRLEEQHVPEIQRRARDIIREVGSLLIEQGRQDVRLRGMGSTLTAARSLGRDLVIAHVGDSRAYLLREARLHRLTKDHTYAQLLVDSGQISMREVAGSGLGHVLTNALGGSVDDVIVDVDLLRLQDGDRLLLCSDGLTDHLDDECIAATLLAATTSNEACTRLVEGALERGGRDNVTVIVAAYAIPRT
jgi:protein phosphatase